MMKKGIAQALREHAVEVKKAHHILETTQNVITQVLAHQKIQLRFLTNLAAKLENGED